MKCFMASLIFWCTALSAQAKTVIFADGRYFPNSDALAAKAILDAGQIPDVIINSSDLEYLTSETAAEALVGADNIVLLYARHSIADLVAFKEAVAEAVHDGARLIHLGVGAPVVESIFGMPEDLFSFLRTNYTANAISTYRRYDLMGIFATTPVDFLEIHSNVSPALTVERAHESNFLRPVYEQDNISGINTDPFGRDTPDRLFPVLGGAWGAGVVIWLAPPIESIRSGSVWESLLWSSVRH